VTPSTDGRPVDGAAARAAAADAIDSTRPGNVEVELRSVAIAPRVSTAQLEVAAEAARAMSASDVTLTTGTSTYKLPASVLRGAITIAAQADGSYAPTITRDAISVEVAKLAEPIAASPQNAGFKFANPEGVEIAVVPSRDGRALDLNQTVDRVVAAMERQTQGAPAPTVQLAVAPVHPVFTTAQAQVAKARVKKVSEWSTRYPVGKNNCEGNNITIPTEILDEYVVAPGQTFDFWREIGGIKRELGYCAGAIILGGTTVEPGDIGPDGKPVEGALGGGICSCSTTIFNAALRYGLPMGARKNHYFYISRYPVGLDATVFRSGGKIQTMEFTNDTEWPILIRGVNSPGKVRFELYTVDVGRQVSFSEPEITNEKEASDSIVFTTVGLSPGDVKRSEKPVDGFEVTLYRTVKDKDGKLISRDRFHSRYGTVRGVLLVYGTGEEIVLPPGEPARWPLPGYLQPPPLEAPPLEAPPAD
jgi:vancomycin resistance protein YoaR